MSGYTYKRGKDEKNKIVFDVVLEKQFFDNKVEQEFLKLSAEIKMPGFRPGKAPRADLEKQAMPDAILRAYNKALPDVALEIISKENLSPIGEFKYDLSEKELPNGDIGFTFSFLSKPDVDVAKLEKLEIKFEKEEITAKEIDDVIKSMAKSVLDEGKLKPFLKEGTTEEIEISDKLVEALEYEEKTYEELKTNIEKTLVNVKQQNADTKFLDSLLAKLITVFDFDVPSEMITEQVNTMEESFKARLKELKLDINEYLATQNTDIEKLRKDWREKAVKDIKAELVVVEYARKSNFQPRQEDVETEITKIKDPAQKREFSTERGKEYLTYLMLREKGLKALVEKTKKIN